ncbi:PucR family transcriptional regulator [Janibacter alittae]|uniref:Helix-turn-helix domain-containing protein n=1 Tax=Janibacter alittae TaxID=3115209 RepID=A0ABZ2ML54_9MICO
MHPVTNLDDELQDLAEALQRRLVVVDARMRVLAYSIHETDADRARLSHLLAHSDTWPPLPAGNGPTTRTAGDGTEWVLHPLRDDRHRVGHLLHVRAKGVPAPTGEILADGAARLSVLLSLRTKLVEREAARTDELLTSLLATDASAEQRDCAATALVVEGLVGSTGQYCTVVLGAPTGHPDGALAARTSVEATLDFVARTSTATVVGGLIGGTGVLVFPRPVVHDRLERVLDAPGLADVHAGIGGTVTSLADAATSHDQAQLAWRAACLDPRTYARVTSWTQLGLDKLVLRLPLERLTADDLPDAVSRLMSDDHREVDVPTLEAYLAAGGDARATATGLGIHRSTLYYRLTRIRSTTGADLRDGVARRDLHTGLRVARLAGMLTG